MIGKVFDQFIDERARGVCFTDRDTVKPDHFAIVMVEFRILAKTLAKPRRVLLAPQVKERNHQQKADREKDGVD